MTRQFDVRKLQLPVPARLLPRARGGIDGSLRKEKLGEFLARGLDDSAAIQSWVNEHAGAMAELPAVAEREKLSPRNKIYDGYFDVCRHGGATATIAFALGQVMAELSGELTAGSGLAEHELSRLLDGLAAVLEATGE